MSSDFAIKVESLSKCYQIYDRPQDRLKQPLFSRLRRMTGQAPKQYYREFWALKDVSFDVKKGETVGIIGRNGSGKSTLLQLICGTLTPTAGSIQTQGRVAALLELGAGFNPEFTGRENVYFNASILGLSTEEIDARFADIAAFADIGDFIDQPVKSYSSGMYVRLAFAVIAHVDADILVIDEALAVGDAFFTQKCMRFLRRFMAQGTVLFVSHDTAAVINLCQKAIWLDHGRSLFQGTPKEAAEGYLAAMYEAQQGESASIAVSIDAPPAMEAVRSQRDMRQDFINATPYRNDIEIFHFDPERASFGKGGGSITEVQLLDTTGNTLTWVIGGEEVRLKIRCRAHSSLSGPIVGFYCKDRLGQPLFGDNTFNFSAQKPLAVAQEHDFEAVFDFTMPILPAGEYSFTVALAEGTQQEHVQHHWIHDALLLKSHSSSVSTGLVGIPMHTIRINTI